MHHNCRRMENNVTKDQSKIADCFFYYFSSVPNGIGHTKLLAINEGCELVPNFNLRDFTVKK